MKEIKIKEYDKNNLSLKYSAFKLISYRNEFKAEAHHGEFNTGLGQDCRWNTLLYKSTLYIVPRKNTHQMGIFLVCLTKHKVNSRILTAEIEQPSVAPCDKSTTRFEMTSLLKQIKCEAD